MLLFLEARPARVKEEPASEGMKLRARDGDLAKSKEVCPGVGKFQIHATETWSREIANVGPARG